MIYIHSCAKEIPLLLSDINSNLSVSAYYLKLQSDSICLFVCLFFFLHESRI